MGPNTNPVSQSHSYGLRDAYVFYKNECREKDVEIKLTKYTFFRDIIFSLFEVIMDTIIDECRQITLPNKMGTFYVKKGKPRDPKLWLNKISTKKKMLYLAGLKEWFSKRFIWSKILCSAENKSVYVFNLVPRWKYKIKGYKWKR